MAKMILKLRFLAVGIVSLVVGCATDTPRTAAAPVEPTNPAVEPASTSTSPTDAPPAEVNEGQDTPINVELMARSGSKLTGSATFRAVQGGVQVVVEVQHVSPGKHGCHIHQVGDCSAADGSSAGGHFNPAGVPHGLPDDGPRHLGDLGNIEVGADGTGRIERVVPGANLEVDDAHSFLGRAIIVHEKVDDGGQPTGNAGGRIGCGVIVKPPTD